ncbi:MAG: hypothetical protein AABY18_08110 [Candidatus Thermoplasmatota archaeon]
MDGQLLACYSCGAFAAVDADEGFDLQSEAAEWPGVPCEVTPGCRGVLVPEALN